MSCEPLLQFPVTWSLYELISRLSEAATVHDVARVSVQQGKAVAGATAGSMLVIAEEGSGSDVLYAEEPHGPVEDADAHQTKVLTTGQPLFAASSASLPLLANGSSIGVLSFQFATPVSFRREHRSLLTCVAQHCVQAVLRARLYEAVQRDWASADAASRSKDHLLLAVSHELRTPLNAILGWSAMLRAGTLDPARSRRAIDAIQQHANRQARLVDDLLDVSRMADGAAVLDLQRLDLAEIVRVAIENALPIASAKGVDVLLRVCPGLYVRGDARRLEQVFLNLCPQGAHGGTPRHSDRTPCPTARSAPSAAESGRTEPLRITGRRSSALLFPRAEQPAQGAGRLPH